MKQFTHSIKDEIINIIRKSENDAKIKIWEEINRQLPLVREKLRSDNISDEEIEKILSDAAEKQYQLSWAKFNNLALLEKQKIFPSRNIRKKSA